MPRTINLIQATKNAKLLEREIQSLETGHWHHFRRKYKDFWNHVREINHLFKTLDPIFDRQRLWSKFSNVCEQTKQDQANEHDRLESNSSAKRELIESKVAEAVVIAEAAESGEQIREAFSELNTARGWMKDGWDEFNSATQIANMFSTDEGRLTREDREACWERIQDANNLIKSKREEMWMNNYEGLKKDAYEAISIASGDAKRARELVKEIRIEVKQSYLRREDAQELHELLDEAWGKVEESQREYWASLIEKWEISLEKQRAYIDRLDEQIADNYDRERNARTQDFAYTVRGWIEEKEQRRREVEVQIRDLEDKLESLRSRINR